MARYTLVALVLTACSSSTPTDGGTTADRSIVDRRVGDGPAPPPDCTTAFGPGVGVTQALVGQTVVIEGQSTRATNIAKVAPLACQPTKEGLFLALLKPAAITPADESIRLLDTRLEEIYCGCAVAENRLCRRLPVGQTLRIKGRLDRQAATTPPCSNQVPCYRLVVSDVCLVR